MGYLDIDALKKALPATAKVESLPTCGVIYKEAKVDKELTYMMFWKVDTKQKLQVEIKVGDTIDLDKEKVTFEAKKDCASLHQEFKVRIKATVPADGPTTDATTKTGDAAAVKAAADKAAADKKATADKAAADKAKADAEK